MDEINSKDEEIENAEDDVNSCESSVCDDENPDLSEEINDLSVRDNKVVTDLAQLKVREDDMEIEIDTHKSLFDQNEKLHGNSSLGDDEGWGGIGGGRYNFNSGWWEMHGLLSHHRHKGMRSTHFMADVFSKI